MILDVNEIVATAKMYKNVVLEGPPGTGKTLLVSEIAENWESVTGRTLVGRGRDDWAMAFHGNTGYEDFVEGIRPTENGFEVRSGFLRERVAVAVANPNADYLILLDEFNRANVAKVLGDSLLLIEGSKRLEHRAGTWAGGMTVTLPYSLELFGIPDNLYFVATMNTSDTSIASLDSALRRRFAFIRIQPMAAAEVTDAIIRLYGRPVEKRLAGTISMWSKLNSEVLQPILGADCTLGHSYIFELGQQLQLDQVPLTQDNVAPDPYPALLAGLGADGAKVTSSFWLETGALTGGSRNQIDLSKSGRQRPDHGSIHFFLPDLAGVKLSPSSGATHYVDVNFNGKTYRNCEVKYYAGADANQSWRINLNGTADDGTKMSASGGVDGSFANKVLLFFEIGVNHYSLHSLDKTVIPSLEVRSTSDAINSGRKYGRILASRIADTSGATHTGFQSDYERILWRFGVLPQLLDTLAGQAAEALLVEHIRQDFINGFTDLSAEIRGRAAETLAEFDGFLSSLRLKIQADGSGLSRTLHAVERPLPPASNGDDSSNTDPSEDSVGTARDA